jgi:hypothetical protein
MDPELEVPTLLYIGRRGRVTERAIELRDLIPSLLQDMRNRMILAIVEIHPPWLALTSTLVDRVSPCGPPLLGSCWVDSPTTITYTGGADTPVPYI